MVCEIMILLIVLMCAVGTHAQSGPSVNTSQGVVVGTDTDGFISFYGIHYAGTPTGENRFKAPTPPPAYPEVYHAVNKNISCVQRSAGGVSGVEDCLVLNIHTSNLTTAKPVLVWIEGTNYETTKQTQLSFDNLIEEDLVVVSINYRLSVYGFLCLGVAEAPGNAGLRDIIQALNWIQENIVGFGGDPNNVVLLGHGSGAAMADLITLSPLAKGLVHKAIILSGSAMSPWAVAYDPIKSAMALGEKLNFTGTTRQELVKFLGTVDINVMNHALNTFDFFNNTRLFAPCVENTQTMPHSVVLWDAPINILRSGNYNHIPYVAGYTDKEGTLRVQEAFSQNWLSLMQRNFVDFIQVDLNFGTFENKTTAAKLIRDEYFSDSNINLATIDNYFDYHGDLLIVIPIIRGVKERAMTSTADVRLFQFSFLGTRNTDWPYAEVPLAGVRHGGMLNFIFDYDLIRGDEMAKKSLTSRFAYFANTGTQPNNITEWRPLTRSFVFSLLLSGGHVAVNVTMFQEGSTINPHPERTAFWDSIFAAYYVPPSAGSSESSATTLFSFVSVIFLSQFLISLL